MQERLRRSAPEVQQGAEPFLLHRDPADLQREAARHSPGGRSEIPAHVTRPCFVFAKQKLQDMDERRIQRLAQGYCQFSEIEKNVQPIVSRCLEGIISAGQKIDAKQVNVT